MAASFPPLRLVISRWLACVHNHCLTLVSALEPKRRKIAEVFNLPSGIWLTSMAGYTCNQAKAVIFTLLNARPVGCRPVTLLSYSLTFCTNWDTCTHTYTSSQLLCACTIHVQYHGAVYTCPDLLTGPAVASVQMARMLCT